jgi:hypothetical protein
MIKQVQRYHVRGRGSSKRYCGSRRAADATADSIGS